MAGNGEREMEGESEGTISATTESSKDEPEKQERIVKLPLTRIKHIIKMDPDVTLASQDAVILIAKATELFVKALARDSFTYTQQGKRKTVQKKDLDTAVDHLEELAFLEVVSNTAAEDDQGMETESTL